MIPDHSFIFNLRAHESTTVLHVAVPTPVGNPKFGIIIRVILPILRKYPSLAASDTISTAKTWMQQPKLTHDRSYS